LDIYKRIVDYFGKEINEFLETDELAVTFFPDSYSLIDSIVNEKDLLIKYDANRVFASSEDQKINFVTKYGEKQANQINLCTIDGYKFVNAITPFTEERAYEFIICRNDQKDEVVQALENKRLKQDTKTFDFPIIGIDFTELKKNTVDFLLNEDFREYCRSKNIKLKRGILLEGKPGTGKTLSIKWIKQQALLNDIETTIFSNIDDFVNNHGHYHSKKKAIFVFEDFDAALVDRKKSGETPNQILSMVLNTLDGIDEIEDVVSIFTTNDINVFDDAFLRPGRIDRVFQYQLPNHEEREEFLNAYIPEEKEFFREMLDKLSDSSKNITYAVLKGICDDINIWKFSSENIQWKDIEEIIENKLSIKESNKKTSDMVL
jgi:ATP-dependent 26S proteasome regulatory subunit